MSADRITFIVHLPSSAHTLVVYETWQCSREQFLAEQLDKPYRHAFERDLPALLATPHRIEFLDRADPPPTLTAPHAVKTQR